MAGCWRSADDYCRAVVGTANARYQKNLDQFNDFAQQRNLFFTDGPVLLFNRLQKLRKISQLAENLWNEFDYGLYVVFDREIRQYQQVNILWNGTVPGQLLCCFNPAVERIHHIFNLVADVQAEEIPESLK